MTKVGDMIRVCLSGEVVPPAPGFAPVERAIPPGEPRPVIKLDGTGLPVVGRLYPWERHEFTVRSWVRA